MTSRELLIKTLEFDGPARVPVNKWMLPWARLHHPKEVEKLHAAFPDDIAGAPAAYPKADPAVMADYTPDGAVYRAGTFTDEWGCTFHNVQPGVIGEVKNPPLITWDHRDAIRIPTEYLALDENAVNAFCRESDKFVLSGGGFGEVVRPFERLQFLRGTENLYLDLLEQPPELLDLIAEIHEFYLAVLEQWARTDVDALTAMDDWGSQNTLLIPPPIWRTLFKPLYREYTELARDYGKYFFFHSDGYILDILPDLIEIGVNAINSQLFCMGIEEVANYRGKITFWGEIDRQHILPHGTPEETAAAVRQVKQALYANGGTIAQCEFGPGAKPENVFAVYETWRQLDNIG